MALPVLIERDGFVGVLRLNRPERHNAANAEMATMVGNALEEFDHDGDIRTIVISGGYPGSFCAGADLKEVAAGRSINAVGHEDWAFLGMVKHFVSKPVIAAVAGSAYAGGVEMLLACDLVVAADDAQLVLTEINHGLFASMGGTVRLDQHVPRKIAFEWLLTGAPISARTAADWGLVNRLVPAADVHSTALDMAHRIAAHSPMAVRACKRAFYGAVRGQQLPEATRWLVNDSEWVALRASADGQEGPRAFAEGRPPQWQGR